MATYTNITSFIKKWEGEYGNDPDDAGGETRKGITYTTWVSVFGDTHERFMAMGRRGLEPDLQKAVLGSHAPTLLDDTMIQ